MNWGLAQLLSSPAIPQKSTLLATDFEMSLRKEPVKCLMTFFRLVNTKHPNIKNMYQIIQMSAFASSRLDTVSVLDCEAGHVPAGRALNATQSRFRETGLSTAPFNPVIKFTCSLSGVLTPLISTQDKPFKGMALRRVLSNSHSIPLIL